jgi:SnoaL-like domain
MSGAGRPPAMSDLEWLVALEEIRQLKARRDRYADAHDWDAYAALHAPEHVSHNDGQEPWTSSQEMIANVARIMGEMITVHHSYDPEIVFDTPTTARGIWAMTDGIVADNAGNIEWSIGYGYYYESYEKRDGQWLFTSRRWHNYFGTGSEGARLPTQLPRGSNAFEADVFPSRPASYTGPS